MSGREDGKGIGRRLFPAGPLLAALLSLAVFCGAGAAAPVRDVASRFAEERPVAWGMDLPGILRRASVEDRVVALTFDACGGARRGRDDYDRRLIDFLESEGIPATLFLNLRWIRAHPRTAKALAGNPLFEIGNHGAEHRPLSVSGRRAYGIQGTASAAEAVEEVEASIGPIMDMTSHRRGVSVFLERFEPLVQRRFYHPAVVDGGGLRTTTYGELNELSLRATQIGRASCRERV